MHERILPLTAAVTQQSPNDIAC